MLRRLLFIFLLFSLHRVLRAQSDLPARHQIYAGYSLLSNSLDGLPGSRKVLNGWETDIAFAPWHKLRFRIDVSGYDGANLGAPQHPYFILGGGQYNWRIHREALFVDGLAGTGGANKTWAPDGANGQTASFSAVVGGGLDTPLNRAFALRVEGGYQYAYFALSGALNIPYSIPGLPRNFGRVSSGIVWNF